MLEAQDIICENFNHSLYSEIRHIRKELGLKTIEDYNPDNGLILDHPLKNKTLFDKEKNKLIHIQNVYKHWYMGYYITLLYYTWTEGYSHIGYRSHGQLIWKNINCHSDIILNSIKENQQNYILL